MALAFMQSLSPGKTGDVPKEGIRKVTIVSF